MKYKYDRSGEVFGRLTLIKRIRENGITFYETQCTCGNKGLHRYINLMNKNVQSCGCLQKEGIRKRSKKEPTWAASRTVWNYYKRNALTRNLEWKLSFVEFKKLILKNCYYCGIEPRARTKTNWGDSVTHNGVDRVDSQLGYIKENCVTCCKTCNRAKSDLNLKEFKEWIKRIYEHVVHF